MSGVPELFADYHQSQEKAKDAQIDRLYRHPVQQQGREKSYEIVGRELSDAQVLPGDTEGDALQHWVFRIFHVSGDVSNELPGCGITPEPGMYFRFG